MTLQELYSLIDGDYEQALRVLRMDKLLDKHIRKLTSNGMVDKLLEAGQGMDPTQLFEAAHAMKGVCANLGLVRLSAAASEIAEEYRPGKPRRMTDAEVKEKLNSIADLYAKTAAGIRQYTEG
ncbi:MAG: Hpt domain-containing protein [Clostridia bacterium]|nr:Hpt domain-containing protein [Clostridia bacterium]MBR0408996.1 Hpt domain-containing protein [Clostridia bacterium]